MWSVMQRVKAEVDFLYQENIQVSYIYPLLMQESSIASTAKTKLSENLKKLQV